jgi:hypothetical protein
VPFNLKLLVIRLALPVWIASKKYLGVLFLGFGFLILGNGVDFIQARLLIQQDCCEN